MMAKERIRPGKIIGVSFTENVKEALWL